MSNPDTLQAGANYRHGFYYDGFLSQKDCHLAGCCCEGFNHNGKVFCSEERDFYNVTYEEIEKEFTLDKKDLFQLPQMIMIMIKLKRMNRYQAQKGPTGSTLLFNPKTGAEHILDAPNVLNRDIYYAQKALMAWLDTLKLSRSSREAKEGIDVLVRMMKDK